MKLNTVIIADEVAENIGELCVMLKDSTCQLIAQFGQSTENVQVSNTIYSHDTINKYNLSEKLSLVNPNTFLCCWFGHKIKTSRMGK